MRSGQLIAAELLTSVPLAIGGALWTVTYILIAIRCFKDRTYGLPMFAILLNVTWESVYLWSCSPASSLGICPKPANIAPHAGVLAVVVDIVWVSLDLILVFQLFRWGRELEPFDELRKRWHRSLVLLLVMFAALHLGWAMHFEDMFLVVDGWIINMVMSLSFLFLLFHREKHDLRGISWPAGWTRLFANLCYAAGLTWIYVRHPEDYLKHPPLFMYVLFGSTFVFDSLFILRLRAARAARPAAVAAALALALFADGASAQAPATVTGQVTDSRTSSPIRDIYVSVLGTRIMALTAADGRYALGDVPPGTHTLRFSWFGYRDKEVTLDVAEGATRTLDVAMEPAPIPLGEIRVTSVSRQPERVVESPAAVATVPPGRVRDLAATDQVPLLIADLPGVQVLQTGVHSFNVNPRSFNALVTRRLLVLVDGRDVAANFASSPEWPSLSVVEDGARLELIRGPGSALYGANAFNGVLNIVTPAARETRGTRFTLGAGELSSLSVSGRHAGLSRDLRWGYRVSGGYARSSSWDRSRTNVGDLQSEYADAAGGPVVAPQPGFELVPLSGQTKATPLGVPGPVTGGPDPMTTARGEARVERYLEGGGAVTVEGGFTRIENQVNASGASRAQIHRSDVPWARVAWGTDNFNLMAYYGGRTGDQTDLASGLHFLDSNRRLHAEGQLNRTFAGGRGRWVFGGSVRRETIDSKGTILAPEHDGRTDDYYGLFGQVEMVLGSGVELVVVARYDDASLFDPELAPRAAVVWNPDDRQSLRLTYGRAYLMPNVAQRFIRFPLGPPLDLSALEAGLRASPLGPALLGVPQGKLLTNSAAVPILTIGDEDLGPEEVAALEAGYKGQFERLFLTADVHYSDFESFTTKLLPGVHPRYGAWTAPEAVPASARGAVEQAVNGAVPGLTRLRDGSTALLYASTNAGRATQWGLDLGVGVQVTEELRLDGNYSYVTVDFEDESFIGSDTPPTNTPAHAAHLSASYARPDGLALRLGLALVDRFEFEDGVWNGTVPGRQTVDFSARHRLTDALSAGVSVTNLLDQSRYHFFGGSIVGRRLMASLTWQR